MKKSKTAGLKAVVTVEMSYLIPVVLFLFMLVVYTVFYYHDKNILIGAASETAVVGAQMERKEGKEEKVDLESVYQDRIRGKLLLFSAPQVSVNYSRQWVEVEAYAGKGRMAVRVTQKTAVPEPEKKIREKRLFHRVVESGTENEEIQEVAE